MAATVVIVGVLTPRYRPWADAVSRLGATDEPHAVLFRAGFAIAGVLIIAGATAPAGRAPNRTRLLTLLFRGYGGAAIVAGLAPKDAPHSAHTAVSQLHVGATIVGGALLLMAMATIARSAPRPRDRRTAVVVGALTGAGVIVFPFTWGTPVYGVVEIFLLTTASVWLVGLAGHATDTYTIDT